MKKIIQRVKADTPPFFKKILNIGVLVAGIGAAVIKAPLVLPAAVISVAKYLVSGGAVAALISKLTVTDEKKISKETPKK